QSEMWMASAEPARVWSSLACCRYRLKMMRYSVGFPAWYPVTTMLRARRGITSSGGAFWLIAAMRMNERSGPGRVISLEVGSLTAEGDCSALGLSDGEADGVHHALRHPLVPTNKKTPS